MERTAYYEQMIPHLLRVLDPVTPAGTTPVHAMHRRAVAFALMRMAERSAPTVHKALAPLFTALTTETHAADVDRALRLVTSAVLLAPPSPAFLQLMVAPVLVPLLTLDTFLDEKHTPLIMAAERPDATVKNEVRQTLHTYLRLADADEVQTSVLDALHTALRPRAVVWSWTAEGLALVGRALGSAEEDMLLDTTLSIEQLQAQQHASDEARLPAALQSLTFPIQPARISTLLHEAKRADVGSRLLLASLEAYARSDSQVTSAITSETSAAELERRSVYFLQLLGQLLADFGASLLDGDLDRILHFIDYACTATPGAAAPEPGAMASLLHVDPAEQEERDDELVVTALQLFLSLLEGHPELSPRTTPMLHVLRDKIERLRDFPSTEIRALSQEVVLVLTARAQQASGPAMAPDRPKYMDIYQEALQYLQDPIIPVRAHGLHLLSQLVSKDTRTHSACYGDVLDPALVPAIFDLLVDAIQDEESFLYLNAVKALAQMATHWRERTLAPLIALYVGGDKTDSGLTRALQYGQQLTQRETDKRLRIGEALVQVLQHHRETITPALPVVVHPLLTAVRNPLFSAALRSSFIAVLGTCIEVAPAAVAADGASAEMVRLCRDLVQIESVPRARRKPTVTAHVQGRDEANRSVTTVLDDDEDAMDFESRAGVDTDARLPTLRRSALLLLAVLLRATRHQLEEYVEAQQHSAGLAPDTLSALRLPGGHVLPSTGPAQPSIPKPAVLVPLQEVQTLAPLTNYVATEDTDALVRHQARDCTDEAQLLQAAYVAANAAGLDIST